ncbi:g12683 [Coccomyxa viridis]|uniref:G12683 protein n=1 Tax=Coccomyxa viridis TaxID=1274662 RepID=A0ABP1GAY4_9CHLO
MTIGRAPQKRCSRHATAERSRKTTQPDMLKAARVAQQAHSSSQRADTLSQRREQCTGPSLSAAQDEPTSATCSQSGQRQIPVQAKGRSAFAVDSQPPSASKAAASEHMPAAQHLMPAAQAQHQDSGGMEHCAKQGRQSLGSAETSRERSYPAGVAQQPPSAQEHSLSHEAAAPVEAVAPSASAKENVHPNSPQRPPQPAAARPPSRLAKSHSPTPSPHHSAAPPTTDMSMPAVEQPARPEQLPSSLAAPEPVQAGPPSLCAKDDVHPMPSEESSGAAGIEPRTTLTMSSSLESSPLLSDSLLCTGKSTSRGASFPTETAQPPLTQGMPEPQAPSQGSKEALHPKPPKGKPLSRPDWRTGSVDQAHYWLMYNKVLHRGGRRSHYQTISQELPKETRDERWPEFGPHKTFLAVDTRLEDDITIPSLARVARYQRNKFLKRNGGVAPPPCHKDHNNYIKCCELCKAYY